MKEKLITLGNLSRFKSKVDAEIAAKGDKETGKGLSSNDYTTVEKNKLAGIAEGAQVNVLEAIEVATGSTDSSNTAAITGKTAKLVIASDSEIDDIFGIN